MKVKRLHRAVFIGAALLGSTASAEDIDIFRGNSNNSGAGNPNVLIILDNTSNWSANNQAWDKTSVSSKCNGDATCLSYVEDIFGTNSRLTQGQVEIGALKAVLNELACNAAQPIAVNVGLMVLTPNKGTYSNNTGTNTNSSGVSGIITQAIKPLNSTHCTSIINNLNTIYNNITSPTWKAASNANYGGAMFEAFKYFGGYTNPANSTNNSPSVINDGTAGLSQGHIAYGPKRFTTAIDNSSIDDDTAFTDNTYRTYKSPTTGLSACAGKNYIIMVGNTWPNGDTASLLTGTNNLKYSYSTSAYAFATGSQPRLGDVWTKFLSTTDVSPEAGKQPVYTYTMNVYNTQPDASQTTLLKSMAANGGTGSSGYYEVGGNLKLLIDAFKSIFKSITSVNTVFSSVALPVSVNVRGTYLNQVYMGMFRPDEWPRWFGNLKLYQLALQNDEIIMVDSTGQTEVTNPITGFVVDNAISFWTKHQASRPPARFWEYRCSKTDGSNSPGVDPLLCGRSVNGSLLGSDSPDGAVVEKGAAAQRLREAFTNNASNSGRKLYTCPTSSSCAVNPTTFGTSHEFNTSNINPASTANQTLFKTVDTGYTNSYTGKSGKAGELEDLINWVRGVNNTASPEEGNSPRGARPSIVGDVLHTRPVVVNYNSTGSCTSDSEDDVVAFYAGNDGIVRAVKGGKANTDGTELWGFIPPEFFSNFKRLRDNTGQIEYPAPVSSDKTNNKPYLIDGDLTAYAKTNSNCQVEKAYLFVTMRRGGRFIYALDVTDKNNPKFLWKRSNTDTALDSRWAELGQTWSQLTPVVLNIGSNGTEAVIFGAGYDPEAEDLPYNSSTGTYSGTPATRSMGRGIFVVNAQTGAIIRYFGTSDGMSHSIPSGVAVTKSSLDRAQYAYVGDTGGNVWKLDLRSTSTSNWTATKLAALGSRKFMYAPDVVRLGRGYAILIGSGDREKPLDATTAERFYMIKDSPEFAGKYPFSEADLFNATSSSAVPADDEGWYIALDAGEKVVGSPATLQGVTFFPTNKPTSGNNACTTNLGTAYMYAIKYRTGASAGVFGNSRRDEMGTDVGMPPSPMPIVIQLDSPDSSVKKNYTAVIYGTNVKSMGALRVHQRNFVYRYKEGLD